MKKTTKAVHWSFVIGSLVIAASLLSAQPPPPSVSFIFPAGGKRGSAVEVTVNGSNLVNVLGTRCSDEKIKADVIENPNANTVRLRVSIAADAELGESDLRLITRGGASNRVRFVVGDLPEIKETEPNTELSQAQRLDTLPLIVNGQIGGEDRDYFRFSAKAGQTFVFEVYGRRMLPFLRIDDRIGWFDPCLTLYDASGKELCFIDDFQFSPDPVLEYTFKEDGDYVICVRDIAYRGRGEFVYRLTLGQVPYIKHVFPLGWRRHSGARVKLHGVNVPRETTFSVPRDAPPLHFVRVASNGTNSNAVQFVVSDVTEVWEHESNDTPEKAQRVTPPVAINGRIGKGGDVDCFVFNAKSGQRLIVEVAAHRFGSPLDSVLHILNAQGGEIVGNDDALAQPTQTHAADARLDYTFPADGDYIIRLKDFLGWGGDEFVYRLTIAPPKPDFELFVTPDNPRVGRGGTVVLAVSVIRKDGFGGEVHLSAVGLPPGFQLSPATIAPNQNQALLTLTAPPDADFGAIPLRIVGTASIGNTGVVRTAVGMESLSYIGDERRSVPVREVVLGITEPPQFSLSPDRLRAAIAQNGKLELVVTVNRAEGIKGAVTLSVQGLPANVSAQQVTIPENESRATLTLNAAANAAVGTYNIIIIGTTTINNQQVSQPAPAVALTVSAQ